MAAGVSKKLVKKERERVNINFNPFSLYCIQKPYRSNGEFVQFLRQMWRQQNENPKIQFPLGIKPNILIQMKCSDLWVHEVVVACFSENNARWVSMLITDSSSGSRLLDLSAKAPGLTKVVVQKVMQFLYEGNVTFTLSIMPQILTVANFFEFSSVKQNIGEYLLQLVEEQPHTLPTCLQMSFSNDLPLNVKENLLNKAADSFSALLMYNEKELFNLSGDVIAALLSSNYLDAPSPIEFSVFSFVLSWLKFNSRQSPNYVNALINVCRFNLMTNQERSKCLEQARASGIEYLVLSKIMTANWQNTSQEWCRKNQCDISKLSSGDSLSSYWSDDEKIEKRSKLDTVKPKKLRPTKKLCPSIKQRENAKQQSSSDTEKTDSLVTAEELPPEVPHSTPASGRIKQRERKRLAKKLAKKIAKKLRPLKENKGKMEEKKAKVSLPCGNDDLTKTEFLILFPRLLNRMGRRLLRSRLKYADFCEFFRDAVLSNGETKKNLGTKPTPNIVGKSDFKNDDLPSYDGTGFLYSFQPTVG